MSHIIDLEGIRRETSEKLTLGPVDLEHIRALIFANQCGNKTDPKSIAHLSREGDLLPYGRFPDHGLTELKPSCSISG